MKIRKKPHKIRRKKTCFLKIPWNKTRKKVLRLGTFVRLGVLSLSTSSVIRNWFSDPESKNGLQFAPGSRFLTRWIR